MRGAMDFVPAVVAARALGLGISTCPTLPRLAGITPLEGATPWLVPDTAGGAAAVTPARTPEAWVGTAPVGCVALLAGRPARVSARHFPLTPRTVYCTLPR